MLYCVIRLGRVKLYELSTINVITRVRLLSIFSYNFETNCFGVVDIVMYIEETFMHAFLSILKRKHV